MFSVGLFSFLKLGPVHTPYHRRQAGVDRVSFALPEAASRAAVQKCRWRVFAGRFWAGLQRSGISNASNGESRPDANAPGSPVG